ncbi:MAG: PrgI family protein [Patescibacteria group bacterium]|jgi:hypothetical protein
MQNRFIVPQFIDAEDRIWGPITVRQFAIVIVGALFIFISYRLADFALFLTQTIVIILLIVIFGFVKINGAIFPMFLLSLIQTLKRPRLRIWKKEYIKIEERKNKDENLVVQTIAPKTMVTGKKLSELSLIIDTGGVYQGELLANTMNNLPNGKINK